ncbi:tubulin binding cofactor C-domain-containing protein [Pelagophyceae sp. CCMP2097]|nr:tubulin binding cofactor C-domain-containing protein [Pelagophyceae sp. CCMP2097]
MADFASASSVRHEALQKKWTERRQAAVIEDESPGDFWASWGDERDAIKEGGQGIKSPDALEAYEARVKALGARAAKASGWLPAFDSKRAIREAKELGDLLAAVRKKIAPRKKFGFRARENVAAEPPPEEDAAAMAKAAAEKAKAAPARDEQEAMQTHQGFFGEKGKVLVWNADSPDSELHLADLEDCVVFAPGVLGALRLKNVRNCEVYAGRVTGPAFVVDVVGCRLRLAARQLRIHDTYDTDFYVAVSSGPIVEDCCGLRFAAYSTAWTPSLDVVSTAAWRDVKDFKWLKAAQSPHWALLPREDYALEPRENAKQTAADVGCALLPAPADAGAA